MTRTLPALLLAFIGIAWINFPIFQPQSVATSSFDCARAIGIPAEECYALVALYTVTGGNSWYHNDNWLVTADACNWQYVWCEAGHITSINLSSNNLTGVLPAEIGNWVALEVLALPNNHLVGEIPTTTAISSSRPVSCTVSSPPGAAGQTFVVNFDLHTYFLPASRRP